MKEPGEASEGTEEGEGNEGGEDEIPEVIEGASVEAPEAEATNPLQ